MKQPVKLLEDLYTLTEYREDVNKHIFRIKINPQDKIFEGHFPKHPVMPGVAMLQIIKELTEWVTGKLLFMEKSTNVKFMALIEPEKQPALLLEMEIIEKEGQIRVKNTTKFDDTVALRATAFYKEIQ